jgi:hypothetical protein
VVKGEGGGRHSPREGRRPPAFIHSSDVKDPTLKRRTPLGLGAGGGFVRSLGSLRLDATSGTHEQQARPGIGRAEQAGGG